MIPGIDPKVDIAFKRVFGSPPWRHLTMALIESVLQPAPWECLVDLELLNPYCEPMTVDDKLSILDIKARDERGRLYNVEMQIVASESLSQRFLYYWSLLYSSQLQRGDRYDLLRPTISICFVNGRMFSESGTYHQRFRLWNAEGTRLLTEDLDIHVLELANFRHRLDDLTNPLDFWLYFLKNGGVLDADALPAPLDTAELRQAMEVLKMFSQDEMARELYQGRLKAERDAQMHYSDSQRAKARLAELQQQFTARETEYLEALRQKSEAERVLRCELTRRIQLCERLLMQPVTTESLLIERPVDVLRMLAEELEATLTHESNR